MSGAGDLGPFAAQARQAYGFAQAAERLSGDELGSQALAFRRRLADGGTPADIVPEALATAREAARRAIGTHLTDAQLAAAAAVHAGLVVEMKDGEGKTLAAVLAAYLHALSGHGVHVVTLNDELARRGAAQATAVLSLLGLRVGVIDTDSPAATRADAYAADVTYAAYRHFGNDYLRDNLAWRLDEQVQRGQHAAVLDEIGSILIDKAVELLGLSDQAEPDVGRYRALAQLAARLRDGVHYRLDAVTGMVDLTGPGVAEAEEALGVDGLLRPGHFRLAGSLADAIRARGWYRRGHDYEVVDGEVVVGGGKPSGRLSRTIRFDRGMRQAIEAREGLHISPVEPVIARISVAGYFRSYRAMAGLTATAVAAAADLGQGFGLTVAQAPPGRGVAVTGLLRRVVDEHLRGAEAQAAQARRLGAEYEKVSDDQCARTYRRRGAILQAGDLRDQARTMIVTVIEEVVAANLDPYRLRDALAAVYPTGLDVAELAQAGRGPAAAVSVKAQVTADALAAYKRRETELGPAVLRELERLVMLSVIDHEWYEHLWDLDVLRERANAERSEEADPLADYRHAAAHRYEGFLRRVEQRTVSSLYYLEAPP